jgi:hypothetical protein
MMICTAICIKAHTFRDQAGTEFSIARGRRYTLSDKHGNGYRTLLSFYWIPLEPEFLAEHFGAFRDEKPSPLSRHFRARQGERA